jgi:hypothetical protein
MRLENSSWPGAQSILRQEGPAKGPNAEVDPERAKPSRHVRRIESSDGSQRNEVPARLGRIDTCQIRTASQDL